MNYLITGGSGYLGTELIKTIDPNKNNIINIMLLKSFFCIKISIK